MVVYVSCDEGVDDSYNRTQGTYLSQGYVSQRNTPPALTPQKSKHTALGPGPPISLVIRNIDCLLYYIDQGVITCNNWMLN